MPFETGNQFWKARSRHGRKPLWEDPQELLAACEEYFEWVEENPLWEMKAFHYQGEVTQEPIAKMRAMTQGGLCIFLGITQETWISYRNKNDFSEVVKHVDEIIRVQKFSGAAADLLNPNIIARDLGLTDKVSNEISGPNGGPIETINSEMSAEDAAKIYAREVLNNE